MKSATAEKQTSLNGVNVDELFKTVETVKKTASIAKFRFRADNTWIDGGHNRTSIRNFYGAGGEDTSRKTPFILDADEPKVLLGTDQGANPVEYVLTALAGCLTTSLIYHAAARGIAIEEVESTVEGNIDLRGFLGLDPNVRRGYENIRMNFRIKADVSPEQFEELCKLGPKFSPVYDSVTKGVPVTVSCERLE